MAQPNAVGNWMTGDDAPFELSVRYSPDAVIITVTGEVDALTAPGLRAFLRALVDSGHVTLVLDLAAAEFMDAAALGVIAPMSTAARSGGGGLTIRSPSAVARRLLEIASMLDLVVTERVAKHESKSGQLQSEQHPGDHSAVVISAPPSHVSSAPQAPAFPAGASVIDAALRLVTTLAQATVGGADGVSVSLSRFGELTTVAATDDTIVKMDRNQYDTGEGPCLSAASEGRWFHVESLAEEPRWPAFIPRAIQEGIASILSTPLMVDERPVGALNIYSNTVRAFEPRDQELAALFATQASAILAEARVDMTTDEVAQRLRDTLRVREVIAQAQGVIMARQGISATTAYASLRQSAKRHDTTLRDTAESTVAGAVRSDLSGEAGQ